MQLLGCMHLLACMDASHTSGSLAEVWSGAAMHSLETQHAHCRRMIMQSVPAAAKLFASVLAHVRAC